MSETDKTELRNSASEEFDSVVDATSTFFKKVFPYGYMFVKSLRGSIANKHEAHEEPEDKLD